MDYTNSKNEHIEVGSCVVAEYHNIPVVGVVTCIEVPANGAFRVYLDTDPFILFSRPRTTCVVDSDTVFLGN